MNLERQLGSSLFGPAPPSIHYLEGGMEGVAPNVQEPLFDETTPPVDSINNMFISLGQNSPFSNGAPRNMGIV